MKTRRSRGGGWWNKFKDRVSKHYDSLKTMFSKTKKADKKADSELEQAKKEQASSEQKVAIALSDFKDCIEERNKILREAHEARERTKAAVKKKLQTRVALNRLKRNKSSFEQRATNAKKAAENAEINASEVNNILARNENWAKNHPLLYTFSPSGVSGALSTENKARLVGESILKKQRTKQAKNALAAAERELQEHSAKLSKAEIAAANAERNATSADNADLEREALEEAHAAHNAANRERKILREQQNKLNRIKREQEEENALAASIVVSKEVEQRNILIIKTFIQLLKKSLHSCCLDNKLLFTNSLIQNIENDKDTFKPLTAMETARAIPLIVQIFINPNVADKLPADYLLRLLSLVPNHTNAFLSEAKRIEINTSKDVLKIIDDYCMNTENWKTHTVNLAIQLVKIRAKDPTMKAYLLSLIKKVSVILQTESSEDSDVLF